ncbi:MAG TPA: hypothetical protein VFF76_00070 [Holophagaceae bacterium]|jgi:hypothetical protein|nr:hypothetical protein [Holophagaceae bacterium]
MRRALLFLLALPILAQQAAVATRPALQTRFLGKEEAAKVLTADDYFQQLQVGELRAKTGLELKDATPDQARVAAKAHYAASTQDFSTEEQALLRGVLDRMAPQVAAKLPLMARTPFTFIKSDAEGGLPHTRGACIILAPRLLGALVKAVQAGAQAQVDAFASSLLVHEQTHVLERQHPELFAQLFTEVFGFKRLTVVPDAPPLQAARVVNPDGPDLGWAFPVPNGATTRWIRPDLLLKTLDHPRMPQDFREVAVDLSLKDGAFTLMLDAEGQPKVEDLGAVTAYAAAFPQVDESFHPNEIAAELLAGWVTGQDKDAAGALRVRTVGWAEKALR